MEEKEGREERRVGLRIGKVLKKLLLIVYARHLRFGEIYRQLLGY